MNPNELSDSIDAIVEATMVAFDVPGMAVSVVSDGVSYSQGYGVRQVGLPDRVSTQTLFAIASCTKAFTSTAMAMLVDDGKVAWDDPVRKHIPFFELSDPVADRLVTIEDLLSHRTGLGRNDLLWYGSACSREALIRRACRLEMANPIRSNYEYNNLMYATAGYAIGMAAEMDFEDVVRTRIIEPLGMGAVMTTAECLAGEHASAHSLGLDGTTSATPRVNLDNMCPTGGISASAEDMSRWLAFQLADGEGLVSKENLQRTRVPKVLSVANDDNPDLPSIAAYACGWEVYDQLGQRVVTHSGGIYGFTSEATMLPRLGSGLAVLCNVGRPAARAVRRALIELLSGEKYKRPAIERTLEEERAVLKEIEKNQQEVLATRVEGAKPPKDFAGSYRHPAFGELVISEEEGIALTYNGMTFHGEPLNDDSYLLRAPFVAPVEQFSVVTLQGENLRWQVKDWGFDREFTREP